MSVIELTEADFQAATRTPELTSAMVRWLRAHDLSPLDTAPGIRVEDGTVTAKVWLRNAEDFRYYREPHDDEAAHEYVVRELRAPLPDGLGTVIE